MLLGALIGGAGSFINTGLSIWKDNLQAKIDEKKRSDDFEMAKLNTSRDTQVASYKHDTDGGQASLWVVDVLRLVRPIITFYSLALVTVFWFMPDPSQEFKGIIVSSILDIASMSVAWWFGDRAVGRK